MTNDLRTRPAFPYSLDALHALPCGCVAAVYRAQPLDTELVSLEARGPHCRFHQHRAGEVLGLTVSEEVRLDR